MALSEDTLFKRFRGIKIDQESVETISSWVFHHVKNVGVHTIAKVWFDVYLISYDQSRIALIYLMNDVCQKSRKQSPDYFQSFVDAFFPYLAVVVPLSSEGVNSKLKRVNGILHERKVFSVGQFQFLQNLLEGGIEKAFPLPKNSGSNDSQELFSELYHIQMEIDRWRSTQHRVLCGDYGSAKDTQGNPKRQKLSDPVMKAEVQKAQAIRKKIEAHVSKLNASLETSRSDQKIECIKYLTDIVESMEQASAAVAAFHEGRHGALNRDTLNLRSMKPQFSGVSPSASKKLKVDTSAASEYHDAMSADSGSSGGYSPSKALKSPIKRKNGGPKDPRLASSTSEPEESKPPLTSIPLPEPAPSYVASIPLPGEFSRPPPSLSMPLPNLATPPPMIPPPSMYADVLPPGVDYPPPLPPGHPYAYDPSTSMASSDAYSPTRAYPPPTGGFFYPRNSSQGRPDLSRPPPAFPPRNPNFAPLGGGYPPKSQH